MSMMVAMKHGLFLIPLVLLPFATPLAQAQDMPEGNGKRLVQDICSGCHGVDIVVSQRATKDGWQSVVDYMIQRGATAKDDEVATIVEYLTKFYGKVNVNKANAKDIESVLGIATKEAEAVVAYRKDHGNFKDVDSLAKAAGVDAQKLAAKKESIEF
jgi:competence protein ComEA